LTDDKGEKNRAKAMQSNQPVRRVFQIWVSRLLRKTICTLIMANELHGNRSQNIVGKSMATDQRIVAI